MTVTVKFLPVVLSFGFGWLVGFLFVGVFLAVWDLTDGGRKD